MLEIFPQTGTVGVLSSEEKGTRLAGWVARGSGAGGSRSLDGWHAALELGARGVWVLDGWHAAQELGARGFGWLARGSGAGGPQMDGWHAAQELDGWHAHVAEELGARRGPRRWVARGSGTGAMVVTFSIRATTVFSHVPSNGTELVRFSGCKLLVAVFNPPPTSPVLLPALVPPDFTKQSLVCTLLFHRSNVEATRVPACRETDACEMANTSVLGPNSHGLSARRCGERFGHDIEHRQQF